jgi:hypothetical protein
MSLARDFLVVHADYEDDPADLHAVHCWRLGVLVGPEQEVEYAIQAGMVTFRGTV